MADERTVPTSACIGFSLEFCGLDRLQAASIETQASCQLTLPTYQEALTPLPVLNDATLNGLGKHEHHPSGVSGFPKGEVE